MILPKDLLKLKKRKDIDYNFYTELQDKNVLFDENYLDLIANNLLSNAFKYTEVGESITVKLYIEGDNLVLQVIDTGIGIPLEKQEKIFERFYQVENGREGSGIGLSLVQRLVELHHGRIILQSEVGKGSTFTIYLPQDESVYTQEELLGGSGNEGEQRVYSTNANDIYIGDDEKFGEEDINEAVASGKLKGVNVIVYDTDKDAKTALYNENVDCAVLDELPAKIMVKELTTGRK